MILITLTWREIKSLMDSLVAPLFVAVFLVASLLPFLKHFFLDNQATMGGFFVSLDSAYLFLIPALSMRQWAEEHRNGTLQLLLTWPVSHLQVVLSKFCAGLSLIVLALVLTLIVPVIVSTLGPLDWGPVWGGYMGAILMGSAYLAIGSLISCLTQSQVVAFITTSAVLLCLWICGEAFVIEQVDATTAHFLEKIGFGARFRSISMGVIHKGDLLFYISFVVLGLGSTLYALERKRARG